MAGDHESGVASSPDAPAVDGLVVAVEDPVMGNRPDSHAFAIVSPAPSVEGVSESVVHMGLERLADAGAPVPKVLRKKYCSGEGRSLKKCPEPVDPPLDIVPTSATIEAVVAQLAEHNFDVTAIPLTNSTSMQRRFRRKYLDLSIGELKAVQDSTATKRADNPLAWYRLNQYRGGRITMDNVVRILGYGDHRQVLYRNGDFASPAEILELGPGNGDLIRGCYKAKARLSGYLDSAETVKRAGNSRAIGRLNGQIEERTKGAMSTFDDDDIDLHLKAIDFVPAFSTRLLQSNICAMTGDVAAKPDELFRPQRLQTGHIVQLEPNSQDVIMTNLLLDRVKDVKQLIYNIRLLAKTDRSTRFMIGAIFPFSSHSDSESPSSNIPLIEFWDERGDIRARWARTDRTESIVNSLFDLNRLGLITERLCELPTYEVYSPHNLIEKAGDLRTKYRHLVEGLHYNDPELQELVRSVLNGKTPNDEVVAFPQAYDNKIVMLSGYVLPIDGSQYVSQPAPDSVSGVNDSQQWPESDPESSMGIKVA